jgi:hypothetical protein
MGEQETSELHSDKNTEEKAQRPDQFAPRNFPVPSTQEVAPQPETSDLQAKHEKSQESISSFFPVTMFTNRPAPKPPPRVQMKLALPESKDFFGRKADKITYRSTVENLIQMTQNTDNQSQSQTQATQVPTIPVQAVAVLNKLQTNLTTDQDIGAINRSYNVNLNNVPTVINNILTSPDFINVDQWTSAVDSKITPRTGQSTSDPYAYLKHSIHHYNELLEAHKQQQSGRIPIDLSEQAIPGTQQTADLKVSNDRLVEIKTVAEPITDSDATGKQLQAALGKFNTLQPGLHYTAVIYTSIDPALLLPVAPTQQNVPHNLPNPPRKKPYCYFLADGSMYRFAAQKPNDRWLDLNNPSNVFDLVRDKLNAQNIPGWNIVNELIIRVQNGVDHTYTRDTQTNQWN